MMAAPAQIAAALKSPVDAIIAGAASVFLKSSELEQVVLVNQLRIHSQYQTLVALKIATNNIHSTMARAASAAHDPCVLFNINRNNSVDVNSSMYLAELQMQTGTQVSFFSIMCSGILKSLTLHHPQ